MAEIGTTTTTTTTTTTKAQPAFDALLTTRTWLDNEELLQDTLRVLDLLRHHHIKAPALTSASIELPYAPDSAILQRLAAHVRDAVDNVHYQGWHDPRQPAHRPEVPTETEWQATYECTRGDDDMARCDAAISDQRARLAPRVARLAATQARLRTLFARHNGRVRGAVGVVCADVDGVLALTGHRPGRGRPGAEYGDARRTLLRGARRALRGRVPGALLAEGDAALDARVARGLESRIAFLATKSYWGVDGKVLCRARRPEAWERVKGRVWEREWRKRAKAGW